MGGERAMDNIWNAIALAVVAMIPGILALILGQRKMNAAVEKEKGDTADILTSTAMELLAPLKTRIQEMTEETVLIKSEIEKKNTTIQNLENQLIRAREVIAELESGIRQLSYQLKSMLVEPVWKPSYKNEEGDKAKNVPT